MIKPYKSERPRTLFYGVTKLEDDTLIAVGSETAYFYIGAVKNFYHDLPVINKYYKYHNNLNFRFNKFNFTSFVPIIDRKIRDMFIRKTPGEPELIVFLVQGNEIGEVWLASEYCGFYDKAAKFLEKLKAKGEKVT